jgi:hypothetical protein
MLRQLGMQSQGSQLVTKYNFFILKVVQAWIDPARKRPQTIHHQGEGKFMVAGRTFHLPSPKTSLGRN